MLQMTLLLLKVNHVFYCKIKHFLFCRTGISDFSFKNKEKNTWIDVFVWEAESNLQREASLIFLKNGNESHITKLII